MTGQAAGKGAISLKDDTRCIGVQFKNSSQCFLERSFISSGRSDYLRISHLDTQRTEVTFTVRVELKQRVN